MTSIGNYAFSYCNELNEVYYSGSKDDWLQIAIGYGNGALTNATIYYNGDKPVLPAVVEITPSETDTEYIFTVTPIEVNDTCHVYGVAYSADGRMFDCDAKELETEGATTVRIEKSDNIKSVKAFVWTNEMQPVALEEIELNE